MTAYTATCHTEGCENAEIPIEMEHDPTWPPLDFVHCGPCGQPITDLSPDLTVQSRG